MIVPIVLFIVGLMLSAFFSGTETGMYRVSRMRLVLDGLSGSWMSRAIVLLLNYPTIFVATALIGNNLANYLVSLAIVMLFSSLYPSEGAGAELLGTALTTPVVFVLGELLPKYLFYHAPYQLLHTARPLLIFFTILFAPVSLLLGLLGNLLRLLTGETPIQLRLSMQR
ncbi:MAG TPA: hemolysin protein, partial [Planctomycetaceae bacterium]|nr:hemolysin protein [Planctomycetaceae bacterium]